MRFSKVAIALIVTISASEVSAQELGLELSQACVNEGCFAGDNPGFPIQITSSGAYYLTSNITVSDPNVGAVVIAAPNVTLDLKGFNLVGPTVCGGDPVECLPTGGGRGINGEVKGVKILNGQVQGFPSYNVALGANARVVEIAVSDGLFGISAGFGSVVTNSYVENTRFGLGVDGIVSDSTVTGTHQTAVQGATIIRNSYIGNNLGIGIYLPAPALVRGNRITGNVHGVIVQSEGSTLLDNVIDTNSQVGIWLTPDASASISRNTLVNNSGTDADSQVWVEAGAALTEIGENMCGTQSTCQAP